MAEQVFDGKLTTMEKVYNLDCGKEKTPPRTRLRKRPVLPAKHLESKLWAARLGFCGEWQLDALPGKVEGITNQFDYHAFRYIDHKEQARVIRQAAKRTSGRTTNVGERFYMDFGFLRSSTENYTCPNVKEDRVIQSLDGFNFYLLTVDEF